MTPATLLKSSWNCIKSSPVVGGSGGIIVSSSDEDDRFISGKASWSEVSSVCSWVSEDPGMGDDGECGALDLGGLAI